MSVNRVATIGRNRWLSWGPAEPDLYARSSRRSCALYSQRDAKLGGKLQLRL